MIGQAVMVFLAGAGVGTAVYELKEHFAAVGRRLQAQIALALGEEPGQ